MIVVEQDRIELDHCTSCAGVWFDSGELELMLEKMGLDSAALSLAQIAGLPEAETAEKRRRCPVCGKKMKKRKIGGEAGVLIDFCPRGDGLWFDGGEVHQIIEQCALDAGAKKSSEGRVLSFLGDTFKAEG